MNFELVKAISQLLAEDKIEVAISLAETKLKEQAPTDFNKFLRKNLLHQTDSLVDFFNDFYHSVKDNLDIKAIYGEMNAFTINCNLWFLDLFSYDKVGGTDDTDWLADWEEKNATKKVFPVIGYEELQSAYENYRKNQNYKDNKMKAASEVAEILIVLRLQQLVKAVTATAKKKNLPWATIPVFASAHDYDDLVYRVN